MITDNAVEEGRLTGAIRPDQANDFALIDLEGDMVICHHASKVFDQIDHFKKCHV